MAEFPDWRSTCIPISFHGDAVPVISVGKPGTKSLDTYSMQGLLASGPTLHVKHLVFSVFEKNKTKELMDQIMKIIAWSFFSIYR